MAGSGDLQLLNLLRALQTRVGPDRAHVTFGSHVAVSMALGLLLLGGGRLVYLFKRHMKLYYFIYLIS